MLLRERSTVDPAPGVYRIIKTKVVSNRHNTLLREHAPNPNQSWRANHLQNEPPFISGIHFKSSQYFRMRRKHVKTNQYFPVLKRTSYASIGPTFGSASCVMSVSGVRHFVIWQVIKEIRVEITSLRQLWQKSTATMPDTMYFSSHAGVTLGSVWDNSGAGDCEYITTVVYSAVYDNKAVDARWLSDDVCVSSFPPSPHLISRRPPWPVQL